MNKKYSILWISGVLGALLALSGWYFGTGQGADVLTAPLAGAGELLRTLSLSGTAGNFLAWLLLFLFGLTPAILLIWRGARRGPEEVGPASDILLYLAVPVLLAAGWLAVNTGSGNDIASAFAPTAAFGTAVALVLAWGAMELLNRAEREGGEALAGLFRGLFLVCAALVACSAVFGALSGLLSGFGSMPEDAVLTAFWEYGLSDSSNVLNLAVLALRLALELVPELLTALTLFWGAELAGALAGLEFTGETVELCRRTATGCVRVVKGTVLCAVCDNLMQLFLLGQLYDSQFSVNFPLFSLALALGLLLVCRALERSKQLQDDNDSII